MYEVEEQQAARVEVQGPKRRAVIRVESEETQDHWVLLYWSLCLWSDRRQKVSQLAPILVFGVNASREGLIEKCASQRKSGIGMMWRCVNMDFTRQNVSQLALA